MATQLETLADKFRQESIARNIYTTKGIYDSNHKNAVSDGDEKGKADIGSSIDIQNRISNLTRNTYNENNGYGTNHPNAISEGDEKGKNE